MAAAPDDMWLQSYESPQAALPILAFPQLLTHKAMSDCSKPIILGIVCYKATVTRTMGVVIGCFTVEESENQTK